MAVYPRAKTVVIFIVCALMVAATAAYAYWGNFHVGDASRAAIGTVVAAPSEKGTSVASDSNWKDTFLNVKDAGTKPYQSDSTTENSVGEKTEPLTATDLFGREFFSKFMTLRQNGLIKDAAATDALVNQVIDESQLVVTEPKKYAFSDIKTLADENDSVLRSYASAVSAALTSQRTSGNEAYIAKQALQANDQNKIQEINPFIIAYGTVRQELLDIPVPPSVVSFHLRLINAVSRALTNAVSLRNAFGDPLQALAAVSDYQNTESDLFYTVSDMRSFFSEKNIIFSPNDVAFAVFSPK